MSEEAGPGDDALMHAVAGGSEAAFRILAARHLPPMLRLARRMLDGAEAEDVAQEALVRVWQHAGRWQPGRARLATWVHTIVYRLCIDRLRQARTVELDEAMEIEDHAPGAEAVLARDGELRLLAAAIDQLPPRQRAALTLFYYDEMSGPEAALVLGISLRAFWSMLHRARCALQERMATMLEGDA